MVIEITEYVDLGNSSFLVEYISNGESVGYNLTPLTNSVLAQQIREAIDSSSVTLKSLSEYQQEQFMQEEEGRAESNKQVSDISSSKASASSTSNSELVKHLTNGDWKSAADLIFPLQ